MKKTIALVGITGCRNRGVEALLDTTIVEIRKRVPSTRFLIFTENKQYDESALGHHNDIEFIASRPFQLALRPMWKQFVGRHILRREDFRHLQVLRRRLREADMVVATGGDIYSTDYGVGFLKRQLIPVEWAQEAAIPVVYLGQSLTRYNDPEAAGLWVRTANRSAAVLLRDIISYRYAVDELGVMSGLVTRVADPSFIMDPVSGDAASRLLRSYRLEGQPYVVVSPSGGITNFGSVSVQSHRAAWVSFIRQLRRATGLPVVMVPHVQEERVWEDDHRLCSEILRELEYPEDHILVGGDHNAREFKTVIRNASAIFAERMHAAMAGLSQGVPTFVVGYSVKARGILTDLLGSEEAVSRCVIPVQEFTEQGISGERLASFWDSRAEIGIKLKEALPEYKKFAALSFERIGGLLANAR